MRIDLKLVGMIIGMAMITIVLFSILAPANTFTSNAESRQTKAIEAIIDKALIQCYALEGSYPPNLEYLESYGVILDKAHFNYYFEGIGSNVKPIVKVFENNSLGVS